MVQATQLRPGMIIIHSGDLFRVTAVHHLTPGNKRGFMLIKLDEFIDVGDEVVFHYIKVSDQI